MIIEDIKKTKIEDLRKLKEIKVIKIANLIILTILDRSDSIRLNKIENLMIYFNDYFLRKQI